MSKSSKLRIVRTILKDRAQAETTVDETVAAQIKREQLVAKRDKLIQAIMEEHGPAIDAETETIDANLALLEQWCDANPGEFGEARSITMHGHRLGYRTGQPKVEPTGKLTFKAILATLKKAPDSDLAKKYVRIKSDLDKEAILATGRLLTSSDEAARTAAEAELDAIGCEIVQGETFYLEPAREGQADTTLTTKAA